jgi:hypothetical protein
MEITRWKLAALAVGVLEVAIAAVAARQNTLDVALIAVPGLVLIWFSELLGSATGFIGHGEVTAETPGWMVAGFGWCVLIGVPVGMWWFGRG